MKKAVIVSLLIVFVLVGETGAVSVRPDVFFADLLFWQADINFSFFFKSTWFESENSNKENNISVEEATKALVLDPSDPHLAYQLSEALEKENQSEKAEECRWKAYNLFCQKGEEGLSVSKMLEWANVTEKESSLDQAILIAERAFNRYPGNLDVMRYLGEHYGQRALEVFFDIDFSQELDESLFSKIVYVVMTSINKRSFEGKNPQVTKQFLEKSRLYYEKVNNSPNAEASDYLNRGTLEIGIGIYEGVALMISKPDLEEKEAERIILGSLHELFSKGYFEKAFAMKAADLRVRCLAALWGVIRELFEEYERNPNTSDTDMKEFGRVRLNQAKSSLLELAKNDPNPPPEFWDILALLSFLANDAKINEEAVSFALRALVVDPTLDNSFSIAITSFFQGGEWDKIIEYSTMRLQKQVLGHEGSIYQYIAGAYAQKGEWDKAYKILAEAFVNELSPSADAKALMSLGTLCLHQEKIDKGVLFLEEAAKGREDDPIFPLSLAVGYCLQGELDKALDCLNDVEKNLTPEDVNFESLDNLARNIRFKIFLAQQE